MQARESKEASNGGNVNSIPAASFSPSPLTDVPRRPDLLDDRIPVTNPFFRTHTQLSKIVKHDKVLVIYTGGTIGMPSIDDDGNELTSLKPKKGYLQSIMDNMNDLTHPSVPSYEILEWDELLDSSDFSPKDWCKIARVIQDNYYDYEGFVVITGTDTMAYTASALSFMLENLNKSVVITGSMIPLDVPVSDARRNLVLSLIIVVMLEIPEVMLYFGNKLIRGNRARKVSTVDVDAFDSPNMEPLATMGTKAALSSFVMSPPKKKFIVHLNLYTRMTAMIMIPGFDDEPIRQFVDTSSKESPAAIVLLLYGSGNAPVKKKKFLDTIRYAIVERHAVIVITTQCHKGAVSLGAYEAGNELKTLGVVDAKDMTPEACVTKLAVLMGAGLRGRALQRAMETNIRGEITTGSQISYHGNVSGTSRL